MIVISIIFSLLLTGCLQEDVQSNQIEPLSLEDAIGIIEQAVEIDSSYYAERRTTEESYEHFSEYFTNDYVDKVILGTGNLVEVDGKWHLAYEGGELVEGSYINTLLEKPSELLKTDNQETVKIVNYIGDGLYAPHKEIITFLYTDEGWKINDLVWE